MDIKNMFFVEFLLGALLLYLSFRSHFNWLKTVLKLLFGENEKRIKYSVLGLKLILGIFAGHLILDPIIPGQAKVVICAPEQYPTLMQNLRVRLSPIKADGEIDPLRMVHLKFSENGKVADIVTFHVFEQYIQVEVYDITNPKESIRGRTDRLSPYVRRGFWNKEINFN